MFEHIFLSWVIHMCNSSLNISLIQFLQGFACRLTSKQDNCLVLSAAGNSSYMTFMKHCFLYADIPLLAASAGCLRTVKWASLMLIVLVLHV